MTVLSLEEKQFGLNDFGKKGVVRRRDRFLFDWEARDDNSTRPRSCCRVRMRRETRSDVGWCFSVLSWMSSSTHFDMALKILFRVREVSNLGSRSPCKVADFWNSRAEYERPVTELSIRYPHNSTSISGEVLKTHTASR